MDEGLLEKRHGLGMFVRSGAREKVLAARRRTLANDFIRPLLDEARALGLTGLQLLVQLAIWRALRNPWD